MPRQKYFSFYSNHFPRRISRICLKNYYSSTAVHTCMVKTRWSTNKGAENQMATLMALFNRVPILASLFLYRSCHPMSDNRFPTAAPTGINAFSNRVFYFSFSLFSISRTTTQRHKVHWSPCFYPYKIGQSWYWRSRLTCHRKSIASLDKRTRTLFPNTWRNIFNYGVSFVAVRKQGAVSRVYPFLRMNVEKLFSKLSRSINHPFKIFIRLETNCFYPVFSENNMTDAFLSMSYWKCLNLLLILQYRKLFDAIHVLREKFKSCFEK